MTSESKLKRKSDGKIFEVQSLAHWSEIKCTTSSEEDFVKWLGADEYISMDKGHRYILVKD